MGQTMDIDRINKSKQGTEESRTEITLPMGAMRIPTPADYSLIVKVIIIYGWNYMKITYSLGY